MGLDTSIFLFFNGLHAPWADVLFYYVSWRFFWIPLYALMLFLIVRHFRKKSWIVVLLLLAAILCTDQTCNVIKKTVCRPRPSHEVALEGKVHLVTYPDGMAYRGGPYGFPSSHAANSIVFAFFASFFAFPNKKWAIGLIFFWSILLGYSRLYLGVHYPGDLLAGYGIGTLYALAGCYGARRLCE